MLIKYDKADVLKEKNDFGAEKIEDIKLLVIQSYDCESAALAYADLSLCPEKQPAHYVVDANDVIKYAPSTTNLYDASVKFLPLAYQLLPNAKERFPYDYELIKSTVGLSEIVNKMYDEYSNVLKAMDSDFRGNYINIIEVCWGDKKNYQAVANNLVKLLAQLIRDHGYKLENIWRAGDIINLGGDELSQRNPYQYTHLKDWHSLLDAVAYCVENPDAEPPENTFCFEIDDHIPVKDHCPSPEANPEHGHSGHIHHWEADDRNITSISTSVSVKSSSIINEDFSSKTLNGSTFMESNFQPNTIQQFVSMESNYYEPIYPDLVCPPRCATSLYNIGVIKTTQILDKLTAAEIKKKQDDALLESKIEGNSNTNNNDLANVGDDITKEEKSKTTFEEEKRKPILGKIPNIFDPYPVDDKIAQLEFHAPMVTLEYENSQNIQDNLTFYVINRFINTEKRLVQLENIMTAQMRMLNRLSSRIHINCVYYGGQSVFDKYKCIRCLSDDLTNDAAIVTLDQCLNCSRYEPIVGQIYEIMDEKLNPGEANIYDDVQASYMTKNDYVEFTRIEKMNIEDENPKQDITKTDKRDESDKDYSTLLAEANNFVMNWQRKPWDYQSPHINEYVYDFTQIGLNRNELLDPINKYEDGWRAIKQKKFDRPDYGVNILGDGINSNGFVYNGSNTVPLYFNLEDYDIDPNDIRFKIVQYAKDACELCRASQTFQYSFGAKILSNLKTTPPNKLVEKAIAGEEVCSGGEGGNVVYTDCSNFTNYIYYCASGGAINIPDTTATIENNDQFEIIGKGKEVLEAIKEAIPGDLILYRGVGSGHVVIYIGSDECCEAYGDSSDKTKEVSKNKLTNRSDFVGIYRHKKLSTPTLKAFQYVNVKYTLGEWVNKFQCNKAKNTTDGSDDHWTTNANDIAKYVDPTIRMTDELRCQFMLTQNYFPDGYVTENGINKFFEKHGHLNDMAKASAWIQAGKESGINPLFLIAHSIGETGWMVTGGSSRWMGGPEGYTGPNTNKLVYNAYGIWCYNGDDRLTARTNCESHGWFTKEDAVIGGAKFVASEYMSHEAEAKHGMQNTIYFMKWHFGNSIEGNPGNNPGTHQYASDITWPDQRARWIYELMSYMEGGVEEGMKYLRFLIPKFK